MQGQWLLGRWLSAGAMVVRHDALGRMAECRVAEAVVVRQAADQSAGLTGPRWHTAIKSSHGPPLRAYLMEDAGVGEGGALPPTHPPTPAPAHPAQPHQDVLHPLLHDGAVLSLGEVFLQGGCKGWWGVWWHGGGQRVLRALRPLLLLLTWPHTAASPVLATAWGVRSCIRQQPGGAHVGTFASASRQGCPMSVPRPLTPAHSRAAQPPWHFSPHLLASRAEAGAAAGAPTTGANSWPWGPTPPRP